MKKGKSTYVMPRPVTVEAYETVVGKKEKEGPLGAYFTHWSEDEYFGEKSFEKAEIAMQKEVIDGVIAKAGCLREDIDLVFAGDLLNQCIGSSYGIRNLGLQYFGLYGACSTFAEGLILASLAIGGGFAERCLALTSSHFCSSERQFRFPLEYGNQRPPTSQWTVTASGGAVLYGEEKEGCPKITEVCPGRVTDMGIKDMNNMGAAMAPAAAETLASFLEDTGTVPDDYDLILTGDLGSIGHDLMGRLLSEKGIRAGNVLADCGMMIYDTKKQDAHAGGSGCGCSASVLCGVILPQMKEGKYRNILYLATGALMSPTSAQQNESIPGIAHLVHLVR